MTSGSFLAAVEKLGTCEGIEVVHSPDREPVFENPEPRLNPIRYILKPVENYVIIEIISEIVVNTERKEDNCVVAIQNGGPILKGNWGLLISFKYSCNSAHNAIVIIMKNELYWNMLKEVIKMRWSLEIVAATLWTISIHQEFLLLLSSQSGRKSL